jgi:putative selenate reductase
MSFSAGADCFNAADLLAAGMQTITVCSDLLKTGGYLRLLQYIDLVRDVFITARAADISEFSFAKAFAGSTPNSATPHDIHANTRINLHLYALQTRRQRRLQKATFLTSRSKTERKLGLFDCIEAPCVDRCAINQKVPQYMNAVRDGEFEEALRLTRLDNPNAAMLGRVCDHLCENTCIRTHLDEPLAIRDIKRFIMDRETQMRVVSRVPESDLKVAIIGAGPGGMAAASELALAGCTVEIFEMHPYAGGMVGGAIPEFRLPEAVFNRDLERLLQLGVKIHYKVKAGRDIHLSQLRRDGFDRVVIMVGAQQGKKLGLAGDDSDGVMDALLFLRQAREGKPVRVGKHIGIIGAGDTAMDCARTAWRLYDSRVTLIYRRTIDQMPADREEVALLTEEGIEVVELAKPQQLLIQDGRLRGLLCRKMEFRGERDGSGRKIPFEVQGSEFEIPVDTLILAISQRAILDFFDEEPIEVNRWGYIKADPESFETSVPGVYAGGDVVNDGPSSIVEATADGKAIAAAILGQPPLKTRGKAVVETAELLRKRALRRWRVPVLHTALENRHKYNEVVLTYSEQQAQAEASRCLDCHEYCSLCVGVCPNLALQTWQTEPFEVQLPELRVAADSIITDAGKTFTVEQAFQIAVLTDFCNECGNCTTFCPTAGEPYRDKPRLYLERAEFAAQQENAFMVSRQAETWVMEARWQNETHRIELNGKLDYKGPKFSARLDTGTFEPEQIEASANARNGDVLSLEAAATMYVLLNGLRKSLPHLPTALDADCVTTGKIPHPAYVE